MVSQIISTNQTSTVSASGGDTIYLSQGTSILVASGNGIETLTSTGKAVDVSIRGEVATIGGSGLSMTATSTSGTGHGYGFYNIIVQSTGSVTGSLYGINMKGTDSTITNLGDISSTSDSTSGISVTGSDNILINAGTIVGSTAISLDGSDGSDVAYGTGTVIENSGSLLGSFWGLSAISEAMTVTNTGLIYGAGSSVQPGVGVRMFNLTATNFALSLVNYGTISGGARANAMSVYGGSGNDSVKNFGDLIGLASLRTGDDSLKNAGTIEGNVSMGGGNDVYKGLGDGVVSGAISGDGGNDVLKGGGLSDTIDGGAGDDKVYGRGGDDILTDSSGNDALYGGSGNDTITGGAGFNTILGGRGNDVIDAGGGIDVVYGGNGNDTIQGGKGRDVLYGGDGNDVIDGGGKDDVIHGGGGNDVMTGGGGADVFVFTQRAGDDVITDFTNNSDRLDLRGFGISSAAAIVSAATTVTDGVLIDLDLLGGSGSIFLEGFNAANLDATDFIL